MDLKGRAYLWLVRGTAVGYKLPGSTSISTIRVGPFTIKRKVNKLAYELDLPKRMKIHPIISIAHLEQAPDDPFNRQPVEPGPVVIDGKDQYVVDRIVGHEQRGRRRWFEVKWLGYGQTTWEPENMIREDVLQLVKEYERSLIDKLHS